MRYVKTALSLAFLVPAFTVYGLQGWGGDWYGDMVGRLVGVFFELVLCQNLI